MKLSHSKAFKRFLVTLFISGTFFAVSQPISAYKAENGKWGFKQGEAVVIEPQYDTTFGFDVTQEIALVANLNSKKNFINPLTKEVKKVYDFSYITPTNKKIALSTSSGALPITEFANQQRLAKEYLLNSGYFKINHDNKIYLFSKTGKQVTHEGHDNISFTKHPDFFIVETKDKAGQSFLSLIDDNEKAITPAIYSKIVINVYDSLIICCTAGSKFNGADDVYNYKGDKLFNSTRHIDYAFKKHIVYKLYEPKILYIILEHESKKEKTIEADALYYLKNENMVMKQKDNYYFYNFKTDKKMAFDKKLYLYYNLHEQD